MLQPPQSRPEMAEPDLAWPHSLQFHSELGKKQAAERLLLQEKASLSLLQSAADDKARAHGQMHCPQ